MNTEAYAIPRGAWDPATGQWSPNPHLKMSAAEQHARNQKAGYSCEHGYKIGHCPTCGAPVEL